MKLETLYQASGRFRTAFGQVPGAVSSHVKGLCAVIRAGWNEDAPRRSLFAPVLLGVGIGTYFAWPVEPPVWAAVLPLPLSVAWYVASRFQVAIVSSVLAASVLVAIGVSLSIGRARALDTPQIDRETGELALTGRVRDTEPNARGGTRITLELRNLEPWDGPVPQLIRFSTAGKSEKLKPGDWIAARASLRPLPSPVAPGGFDFGRKLWFDGIRAQAFTIHPIDRLLPYDSPTAFDAWSAAIQQWRDIVSDRIRAAMSERTGPLAVAFLTGERGGIQKADNQAMRDSSLAHLLSISGIHMMLAGFGFFSALRLALALSPARASDPRTRKGAAAAALVVSTAYLVLSGASVPTQRAWVTIAVSLLAIMCDRSALSLRTVALAATVILIVTPEAWIDPSFQMSFSAVAALVAFYEWWSSTSLRQAGSGGWIGWAGQMLFATMITSLIAGSATAPFAAYHFNRMSVYGVAANLLVTPVVSFMIMPAGVLALMLLPLGLEDVPLAVMQEGLEIMLRIAAWVASWPGAVIPLAAFPVSALTAISFGGIWIVIWKARWRWLGVVPVALGVGLALMSMPPDVIISNSGHNVAVRGKDGRLGFLSARRDRFDAGLWLSASGDARDLSEALKDKERAFDCSAGPCLSLSETGHWVAVSQEATDANSACRYADVLVLSRGEGAEGCGSKTLVIDPSMLAREGAIAVWLGGPAPVWTSVKRERGRRLWAPAAENDDRMDWKAQ